MEASDAEAQQKAAEAQREAAQQAAQREAAQREAAARQAPPAQTDPTASAETEQAKAADEADERNPAYEQSPVASDRHNAIVGDPGYGSDQPRQSEGSPSSADMPVASSAPPPSAQSGVPLAEDRAAGVEPGQEG